MAKKSKTAQTAPANGDDVPLSDVVFTDPITGRSVRWDALPNRSQVRFVHKAWNELLNDSTAGANLEGKSDEEKATVRAERRNARIDSIESGEFTIAARGPRLPTIDRLVNEIADDEMRAICVAKKVALPKGDQLKAYRAKYVEKHGDRLRDEAANRLARQQAAAESATVEGGSLEDILGVQAA